MANPNIVNVTSILGNTSSIVATTSNIAIVSNPVSSNKIYKINSIVVSNLNSSVSAGITIRLFSEYNLGGTGNAIASSIAVPANSTLIVTDKSTSFYLLENKSLSAQANTTGNLVVTTSWEEIT